MECQGQKHPRLGDRSRVGFPEGTYSDHNFDSKLLASRTMTDHIAVMLTTTFIAIVHDRPRKHIQGLNNFTSYQGRHSMGGRFPYSPRSVFWGNTKKYEEFSRFHRNCSMISHDAKLNTGLKFSSSAEEWGSGLAESQAAIILQTQDNNGQIDKDQSPRHVDSTSGCLAGLSCMSA